MPQKRSQLGSKREVRPGVWQVRVSKGYTRDGRQRTVSRTVHGSAKDADAVLTALAAEMGRSPALGDHMTLSEYYWGRFSPDRHATTTHGNAQNYDSMFRLHVEPELGDADLATLDNFRIKAWVDALPPQSATHYVGLLRNVLNQAAFDHVIGRSPMEGYRFRMPRGRDATPGAVWGAGEVMEALSRPAFRESRIFPLWCVMAGAGLSRSEALALDWEDLRWQGAGGGHWVAYVSIRRAVTATDGMKEPKNTRRYRTVPVPPLFADPLRARMATGPLCQSVRATRGGQRPTGSRMQPDRIPKLWRDLFREGSPLEGLPFVHLNRMRATYATIMQGAGIDHTLINAMQGRSEDSRVLYGNYLNPGSDAFMGAARAVEGRVAGAAGHKKFNP